MRATIATPPPAFALPASARLPKATAFPAVPAALLSQWQEALAPVRADLEKISKAVATSFGLSGEDAPRLLKPSGPHRLSVAKGALTVIALELLPLTRETLAHFLGTADKQVYRRQAESRARERRDPDYAARLKRLKGQLVAQCTTATAPRGRSPHRR